MFASKNKQVVQIWIQVSQVEAVLERWSLTDALMPNPWGLSNNIAD